MRAARDEAVHSLGKDGVREATSSPGASPASIGRDRAVGARGAAPRDDAALALDASLAVLPEVTSWQLRVLLVVAGTVLNALATAAYIGVRLGPGPRDGLLTGLVRRTGGSLRLVRTALEVVVVLVGVLLGGTLGPATVVYALAIGPLVQILLPPLSVSPVIGNTGGTTQLHSPTRP